MLSLNPFFFNYKQDGDLGTFLCFRLLILCCHRLMLRCLLFCHCLDPTRFRFKSDSFWSEFAYTFSLFHVPLSSEGIPVWPYRFWSKVSITAPIRSVARRSSKHQAQIDIQLKKYFSIWFKLRTEINPIVKLEMHINLETIIKF